MRTTLKQLKFKQTNKKLKTFSEWPQTYTLKFIEWETRVMAQRAKPLAAKHDNLTW